MQRQEAAEAERKHREAEAAFEKSVREEQEKVKAIEEAERIRQEKLYGADRTLSDNQRGLI